MNKPNRIFIVGHSGAGKGVLAQAVAKDLGWKYVDTDFSLEPSIGRPMAEILGNDGTSQISNCFQEIIANQTQQENIVVTTDDSIVLNEKVRDILLKEFTVYLEVSLSVQMDRISHNRPLLSTPNFEEFLNTLRTERDTLYKQVASFSLSSDDGDIEGHAKQVVDAFKK
jgi:shikimate kinase